jgi:hypothetical protein
MEPWDPRVLLLALACLHLHMTGVPRLVSILLLILTVVVGVLARIQWPTIAACIAVALAGLARPSHDSRRLVPTHLQTVAVPVAVLAIALAGDRIWTNVVAHAALLSAAVGCLQLQAPRSQTLGLYRALTILLTLIPIRIATDSLGAYDTWRYTIAYAGCAGLAPLVFLSIMPLDDDEDRDALAYYYNEERMFFFIVPLASKAQAYQHVLLQVCISVALLGLSTSITFFHPHPN